MGDGMSGMHHHGGMTRLDPFSLSHAWTWSPDWVFLLGGLVALALYLVGVVRLYRRGDRWPVGRVVGWVAGVASMLLVTCSGLNDYGMVLFSAHMIQHMVLSMLTPILLLLGAPITLALRALRPAGKGRPRGPRELLVALLHSRYVRVVSHPAFTIPLFIASLYGVYFTPVFDVLMQYRLGHIFMMVHFLMTGLAFFWPIMGVDPGPHRPGHVMRIIELFMGMPFHAFFGVAVMMASHPLVSTFTVQSAPPGTDLLEDQKLAGGITWAFGEIPTAIVLIALVYQWMGSERRQARRRDRAEERSGDAELEAYNAYLASLHKGGGRRPATPAAPTAPAAPATPAADAG
ncbi:Membrane protein OS=Kitasatospora aureofaciens OX=1894 GN=GCM10010502_41750 PE=4 SV=1 [Kitasatospora aureofaciens]